MLRVSQEARVWNWFCARLQKGWGSTLQDAVGKNGQIFPWQGRFHIKSDGSYASGEAWIGDTCDWEWLN